MCYTTYTSARLHNANIVLVGDRASHGAWQLRETIMEVVVQREVAISDDNGGRDILCVCSPTSHPGSFRCRNHRGDCKWTSHVKSKLQS